MADGRWPPGIPFYSSVTLPQERFSGRVLARLMLGRRAGQLVWLRDTIHAVSFYEDRHRVISTSLAVLAPTQPLSPVEDDATPPTRHQGGVIPATVAKTTWSTSPPSPCLPLAISCQRSALLFLLTADSSKSPTVTDKIPFCNRIVTYGS